MNARERVSAIRAISTHHWGTCGLGASLTGGRPLLPDNASGSVLGYDHDLSEPLIHAWNGRGT